MTEKSNSQRRYYVVSGIIIFLTCLTVFVVVFKDKANNYFTHFSEYEEVANVSGTSILFAKDANDENLLDQVVQLSEDMRNVIGPPVFRGSIKFSSGMQMLDLSDGIMVVDFFNTRTIKLAAEANKKRVLCHELCHALYQSNEFLRYYPKIVTEGIAEALTNIICDKESPILNAKYYDYYLSGIWGLIKPNEPLPNNIKLARVYYYIASLFFEKLNQIDPNLFNKLLYQYPIKEQKWENFLHTVLHHSEFPDKIRDLIRQCTVFHRLSQNVFILPMNSVDPRILSLFIFCTQLQAVRNIALPVQIEIIKKAKVKEYTTVLEFSEGIAEYYLENYPSWKSGTLQVTLNVQGDEFKTKLPIR